MNAMRDAGERAAIRDATRRAIDARAEANGGTPPGTMTSESAIEHVKTDVEALLTLSSPDQRFFDAAAMADVARAQPEYARVLRANYPAIAAEVERADVEAERPSLEKEDRKTAIVQMAGAEDLSDMLRLPVDLLSVEKARAAVAADLSSVTSIEDPSVRMQSLVAMGQAASKQATYRQELEAQSAEFARAAAEAYRVLATRDNSEEHGFLRRAKAGVEMSGTLVEATAGRNDEVAGGTIHQAAIGAPTSEATADKLATLLNGRFVRNDKGEYRRKGEERLAFADEGEQIRFVDKQMDAFQAGVELAKAKGWKAIEATGTPAFCAEAWFHANLAGVEFVGYEPTDKDLKRLADAQRFNDPFIESKQAAQNFALDQGHNVRAVGDGNQRFAGPLVHETKHHVVQDLGRQSAVVHLKKDLDMANVSDLIAGKTSVRVQYKGGRGAVEVPSRGDKAQQR